MAAAPDQNPEELQPYEQCAAGCGQIVSHHIPAQAERDLYGVVPGINVPGVGLLCTLACLFVKDPTHPIFKKMPVGTLDYDLRQMEIGRLEKQLAVLRQQ